MTEGSRPSPKSAMKASTEGSTERKGALKGAPKEREHRSEGGGEIEKKEKKKNQHLVQDPNMSISKVNQVIRYSTYIASYRS